MWPFNTKSNLVKAFEDLVKQHKFEKAMQLLEEIKEQNLLKSEEIDAYADMCIDGYSVKLLNSFVDLFGAQKYREAKEYSDLYQKLFSDNLSVFKIDKELFRIFQQEIINEIDSYPTTIKIKEFSNIRKKLREIAEKIFKENYQVTQINSYIDAFMNSIFCGSMINE